MLAHDLARSRNFLTPDEVDVIMGLAAGLPLNGMVVDLGAGGGTTALAVLEANSDVTVLTVDHNPANLDWARAALFNAGYLDRWLPIYSKSWEDRDVSVDLLLVDASHEYDDVLRDLAAWMPHLVGDNIWFDDYVGTGVGAAVDLFIAHGTFKVVQQVDKSIVVRLSGRGG